jgi:predicted dehydrogenase
LVCTPNDLHAEHAALGLRAGADVILEKPPALNSRELEALTALQAESGYAIHPVLQLRYHDGLRRFRKMMEWRNPERPVEDAYLDGLRERQRRKYSFIARLDAAFGTDGSSAYG